MANEIKFHGGKLMTVCTDNATNTAILKFKIIHEHKKWGYFVKTIQFFFKFESDF